MANTTLLDVVQTILSDINGDEVNAISDTTESLQVAQVVKDTYFDIISTRDFPHLLQMVQLTPSTDPAKPTHMRLEDDVSTILSIRYNVEGTLDTFTKYVNITYKEVDDFMQDSNGLKSDNTNVTQVVDYSGIDLLVINDKPPQFYTSFDDEYLVFNSYDSLVDSTLQQSKTQAYAQIIPSWTMIDSHVINLPRKSMPYFLSEAKSTAFNTVKQVANPKEEQKSRRQRTKLARDKWRLNGGIKFPDYGRK